jgi:hypothetical protein
MIKVAIPSGVSDARAQVDSNALSRDFVTQLGTNLRRY